MKSEDDTKGVIRIRKSKKGRQLNGQKKKYKRTNNDLENFTHKTKDRAQHISCETLALCTGAIGILLSRCIKFIIAKLKSSLCQSDRKLTVGVKFEVNFKKRDR